MSEPADRARSSEEYQCKSDYSAAVSYHENELCGTTWIVLVTGIFWHF